MGRDVARHTVVVKVKLGDLTVGVGRDAEPFAQWLLALPVGVDKPVVAIGGVVDSDEGGSVCFIGEGFRNNRQLAQRHDGDRCQYADELRTVVSHGLCSPRDKFA